MPFGPKKGKVRRIGRRHKRYTGANSIQFDTLENAVVAAPPSIVASTVEPVPRLVSNYSVITNQQRRVAFAVYFVDVLDAPHQSEWNGRGGTIRAIMEHFKVPENSRCVVKVVLDNVVKCMENGVQYNGKVSGGSGGLNKLITLDSDESDIIADCMEMGLGIRQTHFW